MEAEKLVRPPVMMDYLPVIGLGFTALFWTIDRQMTANDPTIPLADAPAKHYLLLIFFGLWLLIGIAYVVRILLQKKLADPALSLGGFAGMFIGQLLAFWHIKSYWSQSVVGTTHNPLDIGGALWSEQLVLTGMVFAGVGFGLYMISLFRKPDAKPLFKGVFRRRKK